MNRICLNMIVKNESKVIERCLQSVYSIIDYWIISDTGSTDNTRQIIKRFMKKMGINGKLYNHKWENFAANRNHALCAIPKHCNYALFIDADDEIVFNDYSASNVKKWLANITGDCYYIQKDCDGVTSGIPFLIKLDPNLEWYWYSPVHNQLECSQLFSKHVINMNIMYIKAHKNNGAKSHAYLNDIKQKYINDAKILENVSDKTIDQLLHLAQSYYWAEKWELAQATFHELLENKDITDEIRYYAMYIIGECLIKLNKPWQEIKNILIKAHEYRPTRLEAIFALIVYCHDHQMWQQGFEYAEMAFKTAIFDSVKIIDESKITDTLMVDRKIHRHYLWDKFAVCAYNSGHIPKAIWALEKVLKLNYCDIKTQAIYKDYLTKLREI